MWYLDWDEFERQRRQDYYLAQIAKEIHQGQVKNPAAITVQKKLMKFTTKRTPADVAQQTQNSKNYWFALSGLAGKKKWETRTPPKKG